MFDVSAFWLVMSMLALYAAAVPCIFGLDLILQATARAFHAGVLTRLCCGSILLSVSGALVALACQWLGGIA